MKVFAKCAHCRKEKQISPGQVFKCSGCGCQTYSIVKKAK